MRAAALAAGPADEAVAVVARAAVARAAPCDSSEQSLVPLLWQVKHEYMEFAGGAVTPGAPACTSDA